MKKTIAILALLSTLFACSDENNSSNSSISSTENSTPIKESNLIAMIGKENGCSLILSTDKLKQVLNIQTEIRVDGSEYNGSQYCDINWDRADKMDRREKYQYYLSESMSGKIKKVPMRMRTENSSFRITISKAYSTANNFVPASKSVEEIQTLVDRAKKSASDALTDEQKALAGDSANDMVESLIRKANQTKKIKNLGDAAYWSNLIGGIMYVLDGNARIELSVIQIGSTIEEDMVNAQKIANAIIN